MSLIPEGVLTDVSVCLEKVLRTGNLVGALSPAPAKKGGGPRQGMGGLGQEQHRGPGPGSGRGLASVPAASKHALA